MNRPPVAVKDERRIMVDRLSAMSLQELGRYADALIAHHFHGAPHPMLPAACPCGARFYRRGGRGRPRRHCETCRPPARKAAA